MSPRLRSAPQAIRRSPSRMPYQSTTPGSPGRDVVPGKASSTSAASAGWSASVSRTTRSCSGWCGGGPVVQRKSQSLERPTGRYAPSASGATRGRLTDWPARSVPSARWAASTSSAGPGAPIAPPADHSPGGSSHPTVSPRRHPRAGWSRRNACRAYGWWPVAASTASRPVSTSSTVIMSPSLREDQP